MKGSPFGATGWPVRVLPMLLAIAVVLSGLGLLGFGAVPFGAVARAHGASTSSAPSRASSAVAAAAASLAATNWTQLSPVRSPSNRDQVQMAYDPILKEVVLFGGYDPAFYALGDTWVYRGGNWTDITLKLAVAPAARWAAGFVYDPAAKGIVLFGGRDLSQFFNDTWLFTGAGWKNLTSTVAPSPRSGLAMAYDLPSKALVLFGGGLGNLPAGSGSAWTYYNDTWTFAGGVWTNRTSTAGSAPAPRFDMRAAYDPATKAILAVGGSVLTTTGASIIQTDTWSFSHGVWKGPRATAGTLPSLYAPNMAWDKALKAMVLIGENTSSGFDPTYAYQHGAWTNVTPTKTASPATRGNFGLAYDVATGYLVLFGGDTPPPNYQYRADTWSFT